MYKGSSDRQDYRARVGSHATKGTATRGVIAPSADPVLDFTITELSLRELQEKRATLVARKAGLHGLARQHNDAALSAINVRIKELNVEAAEMYNTRVLYEAMRQVLDGLTYERVLAVARSIRMGHER